MTKNPSELVHLIYRMFPFLLPWVPRGVFARAFVADLLVVMCLSSPGECRFVVSKYIARIVVFGTGSRWCVCVVAICRFDGQEKETPVWVMRLPDEFLWEERGFRLRRCRSASVRRCCFLYRRWFWCHWGRSFDHFLHCRLICVVDVAERIYDRLWVNNQFVTIEPCRMILGECFPHGGIGWQISDSPARQERYSY